MTPADLLKELEKLSRWLYTKNEEIKKLHKDFAQKEHDYNVALAKRITAMRLEGHPIGTVKELAKGDREVAKAFLNMKVAEGVLKACQTNIRSIMVDIDLKRSMLSYEKMEYERTN